MIFKKIKIKGVTLKNRVVVSPMCQYSGIKGCPTNWHYKHLGKLVLSGAGMLMMESTAVSKEGKITHADLCLSNSQQKKSFSKLLIYLKSLNRIPIGLQISHSGRKGSSFVPWIKSNKALNKKNKSWTTYAPSAIKRDKLWPVPKELNNEKIKKIIRDYKNTARLARQLDFDALEIHMAHGYLLHQFFSPIANKRQDKWGGNLINRSRLLLEISKEVRKIWPKNRILGARITGKDYVKGGIEIKDAVYLTKCLKKIGFDYICVSSGGILPKTKLKFFKGFRTMLSKEIKRKTSIITRTSGLITDINQANRLLKNKNVDLIAMARTFINDPMWMYKAAKITKKNNFIPNQYLRCI